MGKKFRIGMVGCGQIMPSTAKGIVASKNCEICAVHDTDSYAGKEKSKEFNVPFVDDLWEFLSDPTMDAVYIAVPHGLHAPIAVEAARAGKHVMIEKPMVTDVDDGRLVLNECEKAGVKLTVAMVVRLTGVYQKIHELIGKGLIGDIISADIQAIGFKEDNYWSNGVGGNAKRSVWRAFNSMSGGGILIMNAVHNLDALYYVTGLKPVDVMAKGSTYTSNAAVEDSISILVGYDNTNAYTSCRAMSCAFGANHVGNSTVIYGTKGTIKLSGKKVELLTTVENSEYETGSFVEVEIEDIDSRAAWVDGFATAIAKGNEPDITGNDGLMIADLITSAYRSLKTGNTEKLLTCDLWL